jgi:adenine deaminase
MSVIGAPIDRGRLVRVALGDEPADLVLRGGTVVSTATRELFPADVVISGERIAAVAAPGEYPGDGAEQVELDGRFVAPGLIDPHVHIESSNLTLTELARAIVPRGVLSLCEDAHEIANVLGLPGIELFIAEGAALPLNLLLRVPGRVPALPAHLETSGHEMDLETTLGLLDRPDAVCLGGDINPALLLGVDPDQLAKIEATIARGKTVGGQLPGFTGRVLDASIVTGIEDTHVAESVEEVLDQLRRGLRVLLTPRIDRLPAEEWPAMVAALRAHGADTRHLVLCSDDVHPNLLQREGHLDHRVRVAVAAGFDPVEAIQMGTLNAAEHLRLERDLGSVAPGKLADLVVLDDLATFSTSMVLHHGQVVAETGRLLDDVEPFVYPHWSRDTIRLAAPVGANDVAVRADAASSGNGTATVRVVAFGGPKTMHTATLRIAQGVVHPDAAADIASIAVIERHRGSGAVGRGFVSGLGLRGGAVACTVNHDSHNLFVVGDAHESMAVAANALAEAQGGYCVVVGTEVRALVPLPIAGLLSDRPLAEVATGLDEVERALIDELGCSLPYRPIYALNFLCLPNIPDVGVTDQGVIETATMELLTTVVSPA